MTAPASRDAGEFERACDVRDVAPGALLGVVLSDGTTVCVGNRSGAMFACIDLCPHQKFPLSDGELTPDGAVVCARHGAAYSSVTGASIKGPKSEPPCGRLRMCDMMITDGVVFVRPPQLSF